MQSACGHFCRFSAWPAASCSGAARRASVITGERGLSGSGACIAASFFSLSPLLSPLGSCLLCPFCLVDTHSVISPHHRDYLFLPTILTHHCGWKKNHHPSILPGMILECSLWMVITISPLVSVPQELFVIFALGAIATAHGHLERPPKPECSRAPTGFLSSQLPHSWASYSGRNFFFNRIWKFIRNFVLGHSMQLWILFLIQGMNPCLGPWEGRVPNEPGPSTETVSWLYRLQVCLWALFASRKSIWGVFILSNPLGSPGLRTWCG